MQEGESSYTIFDVRQRGEDFVGGNIPGSIQIDFDEFEAQVDDLVKEHGDKENVVFVCMYGGLRSPSAAMSFLLANDGKENVYVLLNGFQGWIKKFKGDDSRIENFDEQCWNELLEHVHDQTPRNES
eukprot:CAMPEP_0174258552 /NCGR_PEP_ID=MMETSP0439-20130205/7525_1 /TAXON_ID=0 /ORGANISM="Stereomyxa ramosa, Strain Chinc5" /LENGTH=126 /DNA_ID=CAMNT_0015342099 /DNA_START=114 /DNA_END=494 /DNA_ORIENTATION=-